MQEITVLPVLIQVVQDSGAGSQTVLIAVVQLLQFAPSANNITVRNIQMQYYR